MAHLYEGLPLCKLNLLHVRLEAPGDGRKVGVLIRHLCSAVLGFRDLELTHILVRCSVYQHRNCGGHSRQHEVSK